MISKLEDKKINYIILDRRNHYSIEEKKDFHNLNTYVKVYEKAKEMIALKIRIENINKYLLQNMDRQKIYEVEKILKENDR